MIALIAGESTARHVQDVISIYGITSVRNKAPAGRNQTAWQAATELLPVVDTEPEIVLLFDDVPHGPSAVLCKFNAVIHRVGATRP